MAYRSFIDEQGTFWEVWEVQPQHAERRHTGRDRRRVRTPGDDEGWGDDPPVFDRRVVQDRRSLGATGGSDSGVRAPRRFVLRGAMSQGWLAFVSTGERRRLCPIPADWSAATTGELAALCARASSARAKTPN